MHKNAVVKEGIRLHDSGSIRFPRESDIPVQYGDYIIPAHVSSPMSSCCCVECGLTSTDNHLHD